MSDITPLLLKHVCCFDLIWSLRLPQVFISSNVFFTLNFQQSPRKLPCPQKLKIPFPCTKRCGRIEKSSLSRQRYVLSLAS